MRRSIALVLAGIAACSGEKDEPVDTVDTDPPVVDTDTGEPPEDTPEPELPDTGTTFAMSVEGTAHVEPGVFLGHEVQAWRFVRQDESYTKPRCVYAWDAINWANAPSRFGRVDPLAAHLNECEGCTFTFTVSMEGRTRRADLPWPDPADTDVDTDVADTDLLPGGFKDEDPTTAPFDCYTLDALAEATQQSFFLLDESRWVGYGFDPLLGFDDDATTGALMMWDSINSTWVPYLYDVPFRDGQLSWSITLQQYQLSY